MYRKAYMGQPRVKTKRLKRPNVSLRFKSKQLKSLTLV